jgi:hypothetical protein
VALDRWQLAAQLEGRHACYDQTSSLRRASRAATHCSLGREAVAGSRATPASASRAKRHSAPALLWGSRSGGCESEGAAKIPLGDRGIMRRVRTTRVARLIPSAMPLAAVVVTVGLICALMTSTARGSFPGQNGKLAVEVECQEESYLRAYTPGGRDLGPLTPQCAWRTGRNGAMAPDWSPDGQRLLHVRVKDGSPRGVATIAADGSDSHAVRVPRLATEPSFGPDGRHLVYTYRGAFWRAAIDGSKRRRLRRTEDCAPGTNNCVSWTAHGGRRTDASSPSGRGRPARVAG